jgi:hypothetical protein
MELIRQGIAGLNMELNHEHEPARVQCVETDTGSSCAAKLGQHGSLQP